MTETKRAYPTWDTCEECGQVYTLLVSGRLRVHGPPNARCPGSHEFGVKWHRDLVAMLKRDAEIDELDGLT